MTGAQPIRRRRGGWPTPEHMSPGCFALVMGTGIITIGAGQRGWHSLADLLLIMLPVEPEDIDPPFWILMGLSVLVVVAGSHIVEMTDTPLVDDVRGLVAELLVPVMVALGVWRHGLQRVPLRYTPALWSIVFPLGMFAASGMTLGGPDRVPLATWLGRELMWVALGVWALTYLAMIWSGVQRLRAVQVPFIRSPN